MKKEETEQIQLSLQNYLRKGFPDIRVYIDEAREGILNISIFLYQYFGIG